MDDLLRCNDCGVVAANGGLAAAYGLRKEKTRWFGMDFEAVRFAETIRQGGFARPARSRK